MDLEKRVQNLLKKNQRVVAGNFFTVPSPERYPFQWLWDSCFHALIYNALGETAHAEHELSSLFRKQHANGLVPHITFWHPKGSPLPNWGRELRGADLNHVFGVTGTSSLTQPPLIARVALDVYLKNRSSRVLEELFPKLDAYFEYLHRERSQRNKHLLFIINPDESGEDNARRFDLPLQLSAETTADDHLTKRLELMEQLALCDFDTKTCMRKHFAVIDLSFNCIYADGLAAMNEIADILSLKKHAKRYKTRHSKVKKELLKKLTSDRTGFFSFDLKGGMALKTSDWTQFMPLFAGLVQKPAAAELVERLFDEDQFWSTYGVRTLNKKDRAYEADEGFWRGPVWIAPHFFIYRGLKRYGFAHEANQIKSKTETLLKTSGFREHYNGETGEGFGAHDFTWAGLVLAMD